MSRRKFQKTYKPVETISVDECTEGFKRRVSFKVFNKDKPTKSAIEVFILADSAQCYVCAMDPYFVDNSISPGLAFIEGIVVHLIQKDLEASQGTEWYHFPE